MPKVDTLKARFNILGYGSSVEDNDIREVLFVSAIPPAHELSCLICLFFHIR